MTIPPNTFPEANKNLIFSQIKPPSIVGTGFSISLRIVSVIIVSVVLGQSGMSQENADKLDVPKNVRAAVFLASNDSGSGTAFACKFRDREFVATNLHVASGTTKLVVKTQQGNIIPLGDKIILAADADICLISIRKPFSELGISPLEFTSKLFEETEVGDSIYCLGNSLGNGVVIQADGKIKAFGNPRLETTTPFVGGNSGGPLVHSKSQKVVALVTETFDNRGLEANTSRDEKAIKSEKSELDEISYFGHRIDTVKKWSGTSYTSFLKNEKALSQLDQSINCMIKFLLDHQGWRRDRKLVRIWEDYRKFIDTAEERTHKSVKVTNYVNEYGAVVRSDVRVRSKSISQADYDKAYKSFINGLEWKIKGDEVGLEKMKSLGYIQIERRARLEKLANQVRIYIRDFQDK